MKVDVALQSYKKPESLVYTLFSLKKYCGDLIDVIYINDDCSGENVIEHYMTKELQDRMYPIKIKIRTNIKSSGYTKTLLTKEMWDKRNIIEKIQLVGHFFINRLSIHKTSDDIRYQWAINNTDKEYVFLIHDDIKFFNNVLDLYITEMKKNPLNAIVGDLGGYQNCKFGPCGKECSPIKIMNKEYPCKSYPITGKRKNPLLTLLGRVDRECRINEWCCLINVKVANELKKNYGIYFGNYECGGDIGTVWFEKIIRLGYEFVDPLPNKSDRLKYYLHWWQGHQGHDIWRNTAVYQSEDIKKCLKEEFDYEWK